MSKFQIITIAVCIVCALIGVYIFATSSSSSQTQLVPITIWGTLPAADVNSAIDDLETANKNTFSATYTYVDPTDFHNKLTNAIATGQGPDLVLIPQTLLLPLQNLLYELPYTNYSERIFQTSFAQAGETFLSTNGLYALPAVIDPLVMYWNRDLFSGAGIALPPANWTDFLAEAPKLTTKDVNGNITESAIAFGEWTNVPHAEDVLSSLMLESGTSIISTDSLGRLVSDLNDHNAAGISPAEEAVRFYTQFADPSQSVYSWNRALPSADSAFLAGELALYFAPASEAASLRARNPNLNFDVALFPQTGTTGKATYADVYGFAFLKSSSKLATAVADAELLTGDAPVTDMTTASGMAPARRDLLATLPAQSEQAVFWQSALIGANFPDPDETTTSNIFANMVQAVTSGSLDPSGAVSAGNTTLEGILNQFNSAASTQTQ